MALGDKLSMPPRDLEKLRAAVTDLINAMTADT